MIAGSSMALIITGLTNRPYAPHEISKESTVIFAKVHRYRIHPMQTKIWCGLSRIGDTVPTVDKRPTLDEFLLPFLEGHDSWPHPALWVKIRPLMAGPQAGNRFPGGMDANFAAAF